jgi:hypothetical protein
MSCCEQRISFGSGLRECRRRPVSTELWKHTCSSPYFTIRERFGECGDGERPKPRTGGGLDKRRLWTSGKCLAYVAKSAMISNSAMRDRDGSSVEFYD